MTAFEQERSPQPPENLNLLQRIEKIEAEWDHITHYVGNKSNELHGTSVVTPRQLVEFSNNATEVKVLFLHPQLKEVWQTSPYLNMAIKLTTALSAAYITQAMTNRYGDTWMHDLTAQELKQINSSSQTEQVILNETETRFMYATALVLPPIRTYVAYHIVQGTEIANSEDLCETQSIQDATTLLEYFEGTFNKDIGSITAQQMEQRVQQFQKEHNRQPSTKDVWNILQKIRAKQNEAQRAENTLPPSEQELLEKRNAILETAQNSIEILQDYLVRSQNNTLDDNPHLQRLVKLNLSIEQIEELITYFETIIKGGTPPDNPLFAKNIKAAIAWAIMVKKIEEQKSKN